MTQEEKDKLLKYLCMALPYGVKVRVLVDKSDPSSEETLILNGYDGSSKYRLWIHDPINLSKYGCQGRGFAVDEVKPYLRPMSSMTKKEIYDFASKFTNGLPHDIDVERGFCHVTCIDLFNEIEVDFSIENIVDGFYGIEGYELLLAHHFDFMGLIPMGCAIEITEENNPYKD